MAIVPNSNTTTTACADCIDMDLAIATPLYLLKTGKRFYKPMSGVSNVSFSNELSMRKRFKCLATLDTFTSRTSELELENRKHNLLCAVQDTQRGLVASADQRSIIEEALVSVECYGVDAPINLVELDGTWRLQYTSAPDVLVLLESASRLPFFQVGQIYQKFECRDQTNGGVIRNVVKWSVPSLLEEQEGATLLVSAKFDVVSIRNIYLRFEEIIVQNIKISEELQAVIAPAILPRSFLSLQILQFLRTFKAQIPISNSQGPRRQVGGLYYLSYLDKNLLLGRAVGGGGVFIFTRSQDLDL